VLATDFLQTKRPGSLGEPGLAMVECCCYGYATTPIRRMPRTRPTLRGGHMHMIRQHIGERALICRLRLLQNENPCRSERREWWPGAL